MKDATNTAKDRIQNLVVPIIGNSYERFWRLGKEQVMDEEEEGR